MPETTPAIREALASRPGAGKGVVTPSVYRPTPSAPRPPSPPRGLPRFARHTIGGALAGLLTLWSPEDGAILYMEARDREVGFAIAVMFLILGGLSLLTLAPLWALSPPSGFSAPPNNTIYLLFCVGLASYTRTTQMLGQLK